MSNRTETYGREKRPHETPVSGQIVEPKPQSVPAFLFPDIEKFVTPKWWERALLFFLPERTFRDWDMDEGLVTETTVKYMFGKIYITAQERHSFGTIPKAFKGQ